MIRVLDLFSGIGGISLGLRWAGGFETVGFCEIEEYPRRVLAKHWPGVWIHNDIKTLTAELVRERCGTVDLMCGGFPCQPHSVAGRRKGKDDARHLWPYYARIIEGVRPRWVLAENVPGLRTTEADAVLADLERLGYSAWPTVVGAWAVGAPHKRDRVWIVARLHDSGATRYVADANGTGIGDANELRRGEWSSGAGAANAGWCCVDTMEHAEGAGCLSNLVNVRSGRQIEAEADESCDGTRLAKRRELSIGTESQLTVLAGGGGYRWPARPGERQHEWEHPRLVNTERDGGRQREQGRGSQVGVAAFGTGGSGAESGSVEQRLGGTASRVSARLAGRRRRDELRALGNSVVPQVVEVIGRWIAEMDAASNPEP